VTDLTGKLQQTIGSGAIGRADGEVAKAEFNHPQGMALRGETLYVADTENHVVRRIELKTGLITTVLGTGQRGDGPEVDPLRCALSRPHGVLADAGGVLYVTDSEAHRIRVMHGG